MAFTQINKLYKLHTTAYKEISLQKEILNKYIHNEGMDEDSADQLKKVLVDVERMDEFLHYIKQQMNSRDLNQLTKELKSTYNSYKLLEDSYNESLEESKTDPEGYKNILSNQLKMLNSMRERAIYSEAFLYLILLPKRNSSKKAFDRVYLNTLKDKDLLKQANYRFLINLYEEKYRNSIYDYMDYILKVSEILMVMLSKYELKDEEINTLSRVNREVALELLKLVK